MRVIVNVWLYQCPFTICYVSEDLFLVPEERIYKSLGLKTGDCCEIGMDADNVKKNVLKLKIDATFLLPFVKACMGSDVFRKNLSYNLNSICEFPRHGTVVLKLILEPPDKEIIDYAWNERIVRLVWMRLEIENAFSWLSTLGGAYSALGDYFEDCAEEAGRISIRQYKLSKMLGDESLAARSRLYSALSYSQKGHLHLSRHIVRNVAEFARITNDKRLFRMCQGVWAKLKYLKSLKKQGKHHVNGKISA
ncbi:uncharacterized protein F58A4.6 [Bombyx mandarina]|uniref:Uncharacterized protein F58A4.6 n=1 Tax=Bombyx mandarina TaxID=7092 RepID=A0A6J2KLW0_BOMMA|nr:uncharacterized protein F58A4.6 [Bombyx mandarina]